MDMKRYQAEKVLRVRAEQEQCPYVPDALPWYEDDELYEIMEKMSYRWNKWHTCWMTQQALPGFGERN